LTGGSLCGQRAESSSIGLYDAGRPAQIFTSFEVSLIFLIIQTITKTCLISYICSVFPFIVSLNLHRRHLDTGQRAIVAARIANLEQGQKKADTAQAVTQTEVARILNVSEDSIQRAQKVLKQGVPELIEKVERGEIEVKPAAKIAQASNFTIPSRAILTMKSCCIRL
jgi:hypothetical protein